MKKYLTQYSHPYNKAKVNWLKSILPILIIIHHIANRGYSGIDYFVPLGNIVMYFFFAMSGYGLVISYLNNEKYLDGFLKKSLTKLFVPYFIALSLFVIYRSIEGIDQIALFKEKGLYSFVPTSWYIFVLSYFYIFFYFCFKYIHSSNLIKVLCVCGLVAAYYIIAPHIGISPWRYNRCPAFCIGMLFALINDYIQRNIKVWQLIILLLFSIGLLIIPTPLKHVLRPLLYSIALFCVVYIIGDINEPQIIRFLSSISLEMFIIQFIAIDLVTIDMGISATPIIIPLVITIDIIIAYIMHIVVKKTTSSILQKKIHKNV